MSSFAFKTEKFEGPLELLLELVEKRKLHITEISLSEVADKFLEYLKKLEDLPIEDTTQFIYIASILMLIKSKALLPGLDISKEEEEDIHELERRLQMFKLLKDQQVKVFARFGNLIIYSPLSRPNATVIFSPAINLKINALVTLAQELIQREVVAPKLDEHTVKRVVSLEEVIINLHRRIQKALKLSFSEFTALDKHEKTSIIVSFLAMLELARRGVVTLKQNNTFNDIEIETLETNLPFYA